MARGNLYESLRQHFPREDMKEVVQEAEGDIAGGGNPLLPAHLEVVVLCARLHDHHGAGHHAGQANPITPCNQCCNL